MASREEQEAFEAVLAPALKTIYRVAYSLTHNQEEAEDLVQETAIQSFRAFYSFTPGTNFKAWFLKILMNLFYQKYRRRQKEAQTTLDEEISENYLYHKVQNLLLHTRHADPVDAVFSRIDAETVQTALVRLPEPFHQVATMYFVDEFTYQEIADMLDIPVGTVRSRLHRARKMLQKTLWELAEEKGIVAALKATEE